MDPIRVRPVQPDDLARVAEIYNEGIIGRGATFETALRTAADLGSWIGRGRPFVLVRAAGGGILGWARTSEYRPRACYDGVAELSVYVARGARRRGVASR